MKEKFGKDRTPILREIYSRAEIQTDTVITILSSPIGNGVIIE